MRLLNLAEGGSNGTTVTTGNSGSASGNAWTAVTIDLTAGLVYSSTQAMHGSLSYQFSTGVTPGQVFATWDSSVIGSPTRVYGRMYFFLTSTSQDRELVRWRRSTTQVARLRYANGAGLELRQGNNSAPATSGGTGTTTLTVNTWYRVEWDIRAGTLTNTVYLYQGDSTSALETIVGDGVFATTGAVDEASFGQFTATASLANMYADDIVMTDVGLPGPSPTGAASLSAASGLTAAGVVTKIAAVSMGAATGFSTVVAAPPDQTLSSSWVWPTGAGNTQTFTVSGTWTRPAGAKLIFVVCIGAGGGGGSGRRGAAATDRQGALAGVGGGLSYALLPAGGITSTVTVTVGAGGSGAPGITSNSTQGSSGTSGGASTFGAYIRGDGGPAGSGGGSSSGSTGSSGQVGTGVISGSGGGPGNSGDASSGNIGWGATGGGGGSGLSASDLAGVPGFGGAHSGAPGALGPAGALGAAPGDPASAGANGSDRSALGWAGLGGGGGRGGSTSPNGGSGGKYGGGGGGGGASLNGSTSGAGGTGGDGIVVVSAFF